MGEESITRPIAVGTSEVNSTVDLDDERSLGAEEVDDVRPDGVLTAKLDAERPPTERLPEQLFGARWSAAHETSALEQERAHITRKPRRSRCGLGHAPPAEES